MKRCIFLVLLAALAAGSVFAQDAGQWTLGGRAGFALGFHKAGEEIDDEIDYYNSQGGDAKKR